MSLKTVYSTWKGTDLRPARGSCSCKFKFSVSVGCSVFFCMLIRIPFDSITCLNSCLRGVVFLQATTTASKRKNLTESSISSLISFVVWHFPKRFGVAGDKTFDIYYLCIAFPTTYANCVVMIAIHKIQRKQMNNTPQFPEINEYQTVPGFLINQRYSRFSYGVQCRLNMFAFLPSLRTIFHSPSLVFLIWRTDELTAYSFLECRVYPWTLFLRCL